MSQRSATPIFEQSTARPDRPAAPRALPSPGRAALGGRKVFSICAALLLLFAVLSFSAVLGKSATYDEPLHAVAGYTHRVLNDYRMDPEDPALFGLYASLPFTSKSLALNQTDYKWILMPGDPSQSWAFAIRTLYQTPGNDGIGFINRSRAMFLLVSLALGSMLAWWSWKLAGGAAAIVAAALFALDPNFLAHGPLVKNDVPTAMLMLAMALTTWQFGRRGTWPWLVALALTCAAACGVKFSGILMAPLAAFMLTVRALLPSRHQPSHFLGRTLTTIPARLGGVALTVAILLLTIVLGLWATYGFRYLPTPDPALSQPTAPIVNLAKVNELRVASGDQSYYPADAEVAQHDPSRLVRGILWLEAAHFLPQTWLHGFLYTYASTLIRSGFLMDRVSLFGWWDYFPLAMAFKTPVATLGMIGVALLLWCSGLLAALTRRESARSAALAAGISAATGRATSLRAGEIAPPPPPLAQLDAWAYICLLVPPGAYMLSAMSANLNLGLRHVLPVYPALFVLAGVAAAVLLRAKRRIATVGGIVLGIALLFESLGAYPNYLAFFNAPSGGWPGGSEGGIELLGDSNLDWGQDLPLLAEWQRDRRKTRPNEPLFLAYFGTPDCAAYGIDAIHLKGGWPWSLQLGDVDRPGVIAVSASVLQLIYIGDPQLAQAYRSLRQFRPLKVLGGSIYLYEYPLKLETRKTPNAEANSAAPPAPPG